MGKRSSSVIVGYIYMFGLHVVLGVKPIDRIIRLFSGGKVLVDTPAGSGTIAINAPNFYSAAEISDGLVGGITLHLNGTPVFDSYLQANYPIDSTLVSKFSQWAHMVFHDGAETGPFAFGNQDRPREMYAIAERYTTTCPYGFPTISYTDVAGNTVRDFNPIEMYWELFIKNEAARYGTTFADVSETIYNEGIAVYYYGGGEDKEFLEDEICRYVAGRVYTDRATGLREIGLVRYISSGNIGALPKITQADLVGEPGLTLPDPSISANTYDCTFRDRTKNYEVAAFTVYDEAHVATYGTRRRAVSYEWITSREVAVQLARRDLISETAAGLSGKITVSGLRPDLNETSAFVLDLDDYGVPAVVCRVGAITERGPRDNSVDITFTQDVFGVEVDPVVAEDTIDTPDRSALVAPYEDAIEAPYYFGALRGDIDGQLGVDPGFGAVAFGGSRPNAYHFAMQAHVNPGSGYVNRRTVGFAPGGELVADVGRQDTTIEVTPMSGLTENELVIVGGNNGEIMRVDGIATGATWTLTVGRGCVDTVPGEHSTGDTVIGAQGVETDDQQYTDSQSINVKLLPFTSFETLAIGDASALPVTFDSRAIRPYPPGRFQVEGSYDDLTYSAATVTLTWVDRSRILQIDENYAEDHTDAGIGPEAGTSYRVRADAYDSGLSFISTFHDQNVGTDLTEDVDLSAIPGSTEFVRLRVTSVRDSYESWQSPYIWATTALSISSSDPADDSTDHPGADPIVITFSKPIFFGTGNIVLREDDGGFGDLETFDVETDVGTGSGEVSIAGNVLTITPTLELEAAGDFAIRIAATAIVDSVGFPFAGIADDTTLNFSAAAGGGGIDSATHLWTQDDMTFDGSNILTAITDQIAASSSYINIVGSPTGDTTDGVVITEATGVANYVSVTGIIPGSSATGTHIALKFKRNATSDDRAMVVQATFASNRNIYARNVAATAAKSFMTGDPLRADATDLTGAFTRDQVWDLLFPDTNERVVLIRDVSYDTTNNPTFRLLSSSDAADNLEGRLMGFAKFTDWSQAAAVAAALTA